MSCQVVLLNPILPNCFSIQPHKASLKDIRYWCVECIFSGKYLVALPPVGHIRPQLLVTHQFPHLLYGGVRGHEVIVGQLVLLVDTCSSEEAFSVSGFRIPFI